MALKKIPYTHDYVLSILDYDPETGIFVWKVGQRKGKEAGSLWRTGYINIEFGEFRSYAHRWAWFYVHGVWPDTILDHINRDKSDNRISNLRLSSNVHNQQNTGLCVRNKSGHKGVHYSKSRGKWCAAIWIDTVCKNLGRFVNKEDAISAYNAAAERHHPCRPI